MEQTGMPPISQEDLARCIELDKHRTNLALRLLELENEKVRILAASKRIQDEWHGLFQRFAAERNVPEGDLVEVNFRTGDVAIVSPPKQE